MIEITPEVADAHAAGLPAESRAHLVMLLDELTDEVEAALIPDDQRDELRDVLRQAQAIVVAERSPDVAKAKLHTVLGRTVATAARAGPATATLWRRVGEWIVLAEATVSLGLGVHAISRPDVTRLEVTCNVQTPALPPAVGEPPGVRLKPEFQFRPPAQLLPGEPPTKQSPPGEPPAEWPHPGGPSGGTEHRPRMN